MATERHSLSNYYKYQSIDYILKNSEYITDLLSRPNPDVKLDTKATRFAELIHEIEKHPEKTEEIEDQMFEEFGPTAEQLIEQEENELYVYQKNTKENAYITFCDAVRNCFIGHDEEMKKRFYEGKLTPKEKVEMKHQILEGLKRFKGNEYKNEVSKVYTNQLSNVIKTLVDLGELQYNNEENNNRLDEVELEFLKFNFDENDQNCNSKVCITDLQNPQIIEKFSDNEKAVMNAFYTNRMTKALDTYMKSTYLAKKLGMFKKVANGKEWQLNATDEEIKRIIAQEKFVEKIIKDVFEEKVARNQAFDNLEITQVIKNEKSSRVLKEAKDEFEEKYNNLYKIFLPNCEHDFMEDLETAFDIIIEKRNLYALKDFSLEAAMVNLIENGEKSNWGYSQELGVPKGDPDKFILGIDLKGFNAPVKLHCNKKVVKEFLENYKGDTIIPVYVGNKDMFIRNQFLTTQVLMKLTKNQRKEIKDKMKGFRTGDFRYKFLSHLNWMMLPNRFPEHLKDENGNIPEREYIDISNGRIFTENEELDSNEIDYK